MQAKSADSSKKVQKFTELIRPGTNIDFIRLRFIALVISWCLIAIGFGSFLIRGGPNWGIDFSGGVMVHLRFAAPQPIDTVRDVLSQVKLGESSIQDFGSANKEFLVRLPVEVTETKGI